MSLNNNGTIRDPYQNFIALSRYARWDENKGRREVWSETVDRLVEFFGEDLTERVGYDVSKKVLGEVKEAVLSQNVMPSMRALMTAGPALKRNHIAAYNCSFLPVDTLRAFDETLLVLMQGTGLGFSVESKYVSKLPEVAESFHKSDTTIKVGDSKEGWAKAYKELIAMVWSGNIPEWDMSLVRPAGARLKTFGGRASGPEPLDQLFQHTITTVKGAAGRRLKPIEAHSIMCKIAEVVVVGGVRRSALISLSDLDDYEMARAKSGAWWETQGHFGLANNSAVYDKKPSVEHFLDEWKSLIESKSGERGIFNLYAARNLTERAGRRDAEQITGTNPSLVPGTKVYTTSGVKNIEDLEEETFFVKNLDGRISEAYCWKSGVNKDVYSVNIRGGHTYGATEEHKWPVWDGDKWVKKGTLELNPGDKLPNLVDGSGMFPNGERGTYDDGFLIGWNLGDGWITNRPGGKQIGFIVSDADRSNGSIDKVLTDSLSKLGSKSELLTKDEINVNNGKLRELFDSYGVEHKNAGLPTAVWDADVSDEFRKGIIDGLFSSDGSVDTHSGRVILTQKSEKLTRDVSSLLGFFGVKTNILKKETVAKQAFPHKEYTDETFTSNILRIESVENIANFANQFRFTRADKQKKMIAIAETARKKGSRSDWYVVVDSVESLGTSDVWDVTVRDETHAFQIDHCITGNCSEINLRNNEFCNLTEVVVRAEDTLDDLKKKVELATILGTWQSTLTDIKYLRKVWKNNIEEERLLGVSLTGQFGHKVLNGSEGMDKLAEWLEILRDHAIEVNKKEANRIGIPQSAAITCVKPSGTVSQLCGVSSGMHPWHSEYYIRTIRGDNKDPITQFMKDQGIPNEPDVMNPLNTTVFSFPVKAPEGAVTREDINAMDHLELWLAYQRHWCEHKPSVTISVRDDEWFDVGAWVYRHFDEVSGVSFLPHSDHTYQQAPYQDITKKEYEDASAKMPKDIDWTDLEFYELEDATTGSQELACSAGGCDVADLAGVEDESISTSSASVPELLEQPSVMA